MLVICIFKLLITIREKRLVLSNLYGTVLQIPQPILQDNRLQVRIIENNL